jgi:hypothetical protein
MGSPEMVDEMKSFVERYTLPPLTKQQEKKNELEKKK